MRRRTWFRYEAFHRAPEANSIYRSPSQNGGKAAANPFAGSLIDLSDTDSSRWGRIGTQGRVRLDLHPDAGAAINALARLARTKRRRGYSDSPA
jgi:hypothetical protein